MLLRQHLKKALSLCVGVVLTTPVSVNADLRYDETTEFKGGIMEGLGRMAGMFGAKGLNKSTTSTFIKGDRLRADQLNGTELESSQIIQLDQDRIVLLDHKKKTYSVMTFAEMRERMEKVMASMKSSSQNQPAKDPKKSDVKVEPKITVKETGETKVINGFNTRRVLLTTELESEDQKTKDKAAMGADTELWLTKDISGFEEQRQFYAKYAQKMASQDILKSAGMSPSMTQDPRVADSAQAMRKKMESLDGVAILTIMSFNLSGTPSAETKAQAANSQPKQTNEEREPESVGQSIGKALGGFGGFGGFGKKKKKKEEPAESTQPAQSSSAGSDEKVTATLMTSTTELKSFSKAALEGSLFEVPAGYKLKQRD
jgi:hypothetical protein